VRGLSRNPAPSVNDELFGLSRGRPLDLATRSLFESRLGASLDHVRIHDDPHVWRRARRIGARAFAVGSRIGFAEGQHRPSTPAGRAVLAHEIAHVALGHQGLRRRMDIEADVAEEQRKRRAEERAKHEAWSKGVGEQWGGELAAQAKDLPTERDHIALQLSGAQAKGFDEAAGGSGWLQEALKQQGYDGPAIADVKQMWAQALVAADAVKLSVNAKPADETKPTLTAETRLQALSTIASYYEGAKKFAEAAEAAHRKHADDENDRANKQYQSDLAAYDHGKEMDKASYGPIGEPGERAFRASLALRRGPRPSAPAHIDPPPTISGSFAANADRVSAAKTPDDWQKVAADLNLSATGLGKLVVASLPSTSQAVIQASLFEALDQRLAKYAKEHLKFWRIPAVFYPKDSGSNQKDASGKLVVMPDAIPWQFYLSHRAKLDESAGTCLDTGEWVLNDLTSPNGGKNVIDSEPGTTERLAKGETVDPPIALFTPLNSKLRFPEGELYFTLPGGTHYVHHMTEPWSASDWLSGIGLVFAGIALAAGVVATGGAALPAAIAFGAGIASAGFGTAGTLLELKEKSEQGLLTQKDKDDAAIQIGLNVLAVASMGLGRIVTAPGAALRFGAKFGMMAKALQVLRVANLVGDVYQVGLVTSDLVQGFQAIKDNPNLSEDERNKLIGQLARRALLTGAMMTIAIKGDVSELRSGGKLHISHVGEDGIPVAGKSSEVEATGSHPHVDGAVPSAPHEKVTVETHAAAEKQGTGLDLAGNRHAIGVSGAGPTRDIYFCSDFCTSMVNKLSAILEVLPANHPMRPAFEDMLRKAKVTRTQLQSGKIDDAAAQQVGAELRARIGKLTQDTSHGATLSNLLDMSPEVLSAQADGITKGLSKNMDIHAVRAEAESKFTPGGDQPHSLADLASAKIPREKTWIVAPEGVIDAESKKYLPDFDRRIAGTGGIEKIKAGPTAEGTLGVSISGTVEPGLLTRNKERVGKGVALAPSFNSRVRGLLGGLAEMGLKGWERLHLWGPGFGDEAAAGMMLGPSSVNQFWQNGELIVSAGKKSYTGIEGFIRELSEQAKSSGGKLKLTATAEAWGNPTPGGFKVATGEPVLHRVEYKFQLVDGQGKTVSDTVVHLEVPDPASWKNPYTVKPTVSVSSSGSY
jgi:hypothetical protein